MIEIEDLTPEELKELRETGYIHIDGVKYKTKLCLECKVIDKDGNIREV